MVEPVRSLGGEETNNLSRQSGPTVDLRGDVIVREGVLQEVFKDSYECGISIKMVALLTFPLLKLQSSMCAICYFNHYVSFSVMQLRETSI